MNKKVSNEELSKVVARSKSYSEVLRRLNRQPAGGSWQYIKTRIVEQKIDTSHFAGGLDKRGRVHRGGDEKHHWSMILKKGNGVGRERSKKLRRAYTEYCKEKNIEICCKGCKNSGEWFGKKLILEINHIDECRTNNRPDNLEWLCPNCHSVKTF